MTEESVACIVKEYKRAFKERITRIYQVTDCHNQEELAQFLGVWQDEIVRARSLSHIPSTWQLILLDKLNINPAWILDGKSPKYLRPADQPGELIPAWKRSNTPVRNINWGLAKCSNQELAEELLQRLSES